MDFLQRQAERKKIIRFGKQIMNQAVTLKKEIIETFLPYNPEKIVLFGSYAWENHDEESDIDIIIVYQTPKRFVDRLKELYLSWDIPKAVDILAYTPEEFDRLMEESSFVSQAVKQGELIYERTE
ncbi:MAG: nucleotidyltransferase domain-containing protein [Thermodesulfobacteriota bacterium]